MKKLISDESYIENLYKILDTSYDGIYITDGEANTILINKSYERITGLRREDLLGRNMSEIVKDGVMSEVTSLMVLEKREPVTLNQMFNTGKSALVTSTPLFDENGDIKMIVSNVRDITELKELQETVRETKSENIKHKGIIEELKLQIASNEYIVAEDENMLNLLLLAKRVARVNTTVLINGETGSGKEVLAKYIYNNSLRKHMQFIKINCGAIPDNLIESEFFGYAEGSFTGASKGGKMGIFEAANNGTLLLDEVGELPLNMQVKLLRVLQDGQFERIGSNSTIKVDVRIIASTNKNLEDMVRKGLFREDLFYRLNVVPLTAIPLRERKSSIIPSAEYFVNVFNKKYGMSKTISKEALKYLYEYSWPGNVRELRNLIEMLVVTTVDEVIYANNLPGHILNNEKSGEGAMEDYIPRLSLAVGELEKELIAKAFKKCGNVRGAAAELGIDPATFVRKRKKYE